MASGPGTLEAHQMSSAAERIQDARILIGWTRSNLQQVSNGLVSPRAASDRPIRETSDSRL